MSNANEAAYPKLHIGGVEPDHERCLRCASMFLDTGWECTECGYDNLPHYANPSVTSAKEPT